MCVDYSQVHFPFKCAVCDSNSSHFIAKFINLLLILQFPSSSFSECTERPRLRPCPSIVDLTDLKQFQHTNMWIQIHRMESFQGVLSTCLSNVRWATLRSDIAVFEVIIFISVLLCSFIDRHSSHSQTAQVQGLWFQWNFSGTQRPWSFSLMEIHSKCLRCVEDRAIISFLNTV